MKHRTISIVIALGSLAVGALGGYFYGCRATSNVDVELLHALELSHGGLDANAATLVLKDLRDGKPDSVAERLETQLDWALIAMGREFSPERDVYGTAA